jgi:hypothetical protein
MSLRPFFPRHASRRAFLRTLGAGGAALLLPRSLPAADPASAPLFEEIDPAQSGITFVHENAMSPSRYLPETMGPGVAFLDYDNDGWLDLIVGNGHVYPIADQFDWNTSYRQRALLFRNLAGKFVEVAGSAGAGLAVPRPSRGLAVGDLDNDGDEDVVLNNLDEAPTLLRNDGGNQAGHWLAVRLIGEPARGCPRDAIGSVVFGTAGGLRRRGEVASGRSQISQSDLRVHFGLGVATRVERLEVRWANGATVAYDIPSVDRQVVIDQASGVVAAPPPPAH